MSGLSEVLEALARVAGVDFRGWLLAWARVLPVVLLVPAFGLGSVLLPIRIGLALALALAIAPGLRVLAGGEEPLWFAVGREVARGLPLAIGTAALLWAAVMAGGLADNLRGGRESSEVPVLEEPAPPLAAVFGLLVGFAFLAGGGAERVISALAEPQLTSTWGAAAQRLSQAIGLAVALAAPLVAASLLVEIAGAFVARAAAPAYVLPLLAPLRSLALLFVVWLALDRLVELFVVLASAAPP